MNGLKDTALIAVLVVAVSAAAAWLFGGMEGEAPPRREPSPPPVSAPALPAPQPRRAEPDGTGAGLAWLKKEQHPDGHWDLSPRRTGLALLAYLAAGESHKKGRYKKTVREGLKFLKQIQDPQGLYVVPDHARSDQAHAIATLAMVEAYLLTRSPLFKQSAQQAVDFLQSIEEPDDLTAGWACLVLWEGKAGGLRIDPAAGWRLARRYEPGSRDYDAAGHAMGLLGAVLWLGPLEVESRWVAGQAPFRNALGHCQDPYYLYFGSWLAPEFGLDFDSAWRGDLRALVAPLQDSDGSFASLGPQASWIGKAGTTGLMTAAAAMTKWNPDAAIRQNGPHVRPR